MAIKRYTANKDNTITNAFKANLQDRGTDANMGESDIIETFTILGQANSLSQEQSRILLQFPADSISGSRDAGDIPNSGSVDFYLRVYNAPHGQTLPNDYTLQIYPISGKEWTEGHGLDMEDYSDIGASNWISASTGVAWTTEGGDLDESGIYPYTQYIAKGTQDIEVNITDLAETWISSPETNYGLLIRMSQSSDTFTSGTLADTSVTGNLVDVLGTSVNYDAMTSEQKAAISN
jgi:hypothetical protein